MVASVAEAEVGGLFHNGQTAVPQRIKLHELGFTQPPTPMKTDNSAAEGIFIATVIQKRSKAIDMRSYWMKDRVLKKDFFVYWKPGSQNMGDYFTKHHPQHHHRNIRATYLYIENSLLKINHKIITSLFGHTSRAGVQENNKGGESEMDYIKIFQNAQAFLVPLENSYSNDQLMHIFLDSFHQGVTYTAQIVSHQAELRREEIIMTKNIYLLHLYRLTI